MKYSYKDLLNTKRFQESTISRSKPIDEFNSDRSRIIYCSSFRRLLQKAQVFSLEPNASVRTRLTHSLEVADLGRSIATKIAYKLSSDKILPDRSIQNFVTIVESACLLHDIGNPPFGHFGEAAIKDWANNYHSKEKKLDTKIDQKLFNILLSDFKEFDGNPQGFRTITKLHTERDRFSLNLTYATLLCTLKYSRAASETQGTGITKKAGFFLTEKDDVEKLWKEVHIESHSRYPLTYIMEAADDIAYCMSDIADGIEKKILTCDSFIESFKQEWKNVYGNIEIPVILPQTNINASFNHNISIPWSKKAMDEAVEVYFNNHEAIYKGQFDSLISENNPMGKVLETIKRVSRKKLYTSPEAESIELTGYAVISGILHRYERLIKLDANTFEEIVNGNTPKSCDIERRLFNRLGKRYVDAYKYAVESYKEKEKYETYELWLRIHLIIDHISGMTDEYALETYQALEGISLTTL